MWLEFSRSYLHHVVCFRTVLGIITKKNMVEHLEELARRTEPLVIPCQPAPQPRAGAQPGTVTSLHTHR